jgi:hypothetical protein
MKVIVPENLKDITLKEYLEYNKLTERKDLSKNDFLKRKVAIFTKLTNKEVTSVVAKDLLELSNDIDKALNTQFVFADRFEINGVPFGFIPNFDDISFAEYVDLKEYSKDENELNKFMAILYRPVIKEDVFNNYEIEKYNGTTEYKDVMLSMPISVLKGAMGFFLTLQNELLIAIQKFTQEVRMKEVVR